MATGNSYALHINLAARMIALARSGLIFEKSEDHEWLHKAAALAKANAANFDAPRKSTSAAEAWVCPVLVA